MNIQLRKITSEQKDVLNNLMEKHTYEFSQYDQIPFDETGLYRDSHVDSYFREQGRFSYLIYVDGKLAGLALICKRAEASVPLDWAVAEFFIAYQYRRKGVGTYVMKQLFAQYKGVWQIKYHPKNQASEIFWQKIASEASGGKFRIVRGIEDYYDGTPARVLVLEVK